MTKSTASDPIRALREQGARYVVGQGESRIGRLLLYDALEMRFRELKLGNNPDCPVCGEDPTVTQLTDYETFRASQSVSLASIVKMNG